MTQPATTNYLFAGFSLRITGSEISLHDRDGHPVRLTLHESKTLQRLVEKRGEFVSKPDLVEEFFETPDGDMGAVNTAIYGLRLKLHDAKEASTLIRTESKGYRFVAPVREMRDDSADDVTTREIATAILEHGTRIEEYQSGRSIQNADDSSSIQITAGSTSIESKQEGDTFEKWLLGRGRVLTGTLLVLVLVTVVISQRFSFGPASLAQLLVILLAFCHSLLLRRPKGFGPTKQYREEDVRRAGYETLRDFEEDKATPDRLEQYTKYWRLLLLSWVFLYAFLAITSYKGWELEILIASGANKLLGVKLIIFNTLFNYANTLMIVLCFYVLNKNGEHQQEGPGAKKALPVIGVVAFVGGNLLLVAFLFIAQLSGENRVANLVTGIVAGIAMALFVGRLQSKFLGPPSWLLVALYSYTAIQPLFVYLEQNSPGAVLLIDVALILKCLLYLYMAWLFQSGDLLFYFARVMRTYRTVPEQRRAFRKLLESEI